MRVGLGEAIRWMEYGSLPQVCIVSASPGNVQSPLSVLSSRAKDGLSS